MFRLPAFVVDVFRPVRLLCLWFVAVALSIVTRIGAFARRPFSPLTAYATATCLLLVALVLSPIPVRADDGSIIGSSSIVLLIAGLAVNLFGTLWALFVAHAAKSEATWDDWIVSRVRDVARDVVKEEQGSPLPVLADGNAVSGKSP